MNNKNVFYSILESKKVKIEEVEELVSDGAVAKIIIKSLQYRDGDLSGSGYASLESDGSLSLYMEYVIEGLQCDVIHEIKGGKESMTFENLGDSSATVATQCGTIEQFVVRGVGTSTVNRDTCTPFFRLR